ncbi:hypothetical protein [Naasia sp. SYSU D00948]|uniref:hypothetical protein n=1 Tax=Naasia sp. SYSU D00948 TaxID=2817379 RepID=UPI001B30B0C4|nr:hypothetical protein [Naasia sp. SYSU D00948]
MTEAALLDASAEFETGFVQKQDGIVRRVLVRDGAGGYADLVFFESAEAMEKVIEAEQDDEVCARFSSIMVDGGEYRVFEVLRTYE